jgi:membrane-associated phospholipid phosphatase
MMSANPPVARRGLPEPGASRGRLAWRLRFEDPGPPRARRVWLIGALVAAVLVALLAVAIGTHTVQRQDMRLLVGLHDRLVNGGLILTADETADWVSKWLGPGPHLIPLTLLVSYLAFRAGRLRLALFVPLAFALGMFGQGMVKDLVGRTRPNLYPSMATVTGPSFPSGHAVGAICAMAVPLLVAAWLTRRRWLRWSLVAAAVVAVLSIDLSRLILAVHWPTDVLAGNLFALAVCGVLAAALGLPAPGLARAGRPAPRLLGSFWNRVDPVRPAADPGVEGNRRLTALAGALLVPVLLAVILSGLLFGSSPALHFFAGFVAIPLTVLKLGSTGWRFAGYYLHRSQRYRAAGPPAIAPRVLAPLLVVSALVAFATGVALFAEGTTHGTLATLHTDSAVVFIVVVLAHVAIHARTAWVESASEVGGTPAVRGWGTRRATLIAVTVAAVALAAGLTFAYPWNV